MTDHVLEPAAQQIADATSRPPFLYDLGVDGARKVLDDLQAAPIAKLDVDDTWITVPADVGDVPVRIVKPVGADGLLLPTVLYVHGGGWVLGNAATHDRLVRELAVLAHAAVVFVEYDRSPEVQYPVAIEQAYATAQWIIRDGVAAGLDHRRLAVAGDSVGGNMAAALTILAKQRGDVTFVHQSLYYPVTDAAQDTDSYREFAHGPVPPRAVDGVVLGLRTCRTGSAAPRSRPHRCGRRWTSSPVSRTPSSSSTRTTSCATRARPTPASLTAAGVRTTCVRVNGTLHDFMMLNPLRETAAATAAIEQAVHVLRTALAAALNRSLPPKAAVPCHRTSPRSSSSTVPSPSRPAGTR